MTFEPLQQTVLFAAFEHSEHIIFGRLFDVSHIVSDLVEWFCPGLSSGIEGKNHERGGEDRRRPRKKEASRSKNNRH